MNREYELIRRERDLLKRELELMKQEKEGFRARTNRSPNTNDVSNIKGLKDLLSEFDGAGSEFQGWKQQVELLCDTHNLDDKATRVLVSSRLKGKALSWFHSKPEHIVLNAAALLEEMRRMFEHRPSKQALRREFEQRMWQPGESFTEYYHDKIILANRISIG